MCVDFVCFGYFGFGFIDLGYWCFVLVMFGVFVGMCYCCFWVSALVTWLGECVFSSVVLVLALQFRCYICLVFLFASVLFVYVCFECLGAYCLLRFDCCGFCYVCCVKVWFDFGLGLFLVC